MGERNPCFLPFILSNILPVRNYNHWQKKSQVFHINYLFDFCYNDIVIYMPEKKNIKLKNCFSEIKKLNDFLGEFLQHHSLNILNHQDIQLSLEEIFNNILLYAYPDRQAHEISFQFNLENKVLWICIEDDGIPFNLLEVKEPELTTPLQERQVGGLGIHLIRSLMDEISYQRKNNKNILTIKKNTN